MMRMRFLGLSLVALTALGTAALGTGACGSATGGPAPAAPLAATTLPSGSGASVAAEFAHCLQGDGGAACFNSRAVPVLNTREQAALVAPSAPGNFIASSSGSTVFLAWAAPAFGDPATSYNIEAGSAPGLANLANFNTGNNLTTFSASGVGSGTYYVRIRAVNAAGVSGPSNEVVLVVGSTGACAGPPTNLTPITQSAGFIAFGWSAPATGSPNSYVIEAGSAPGLSNLANFDTGSPATSFSASGIGAGSYYVRVRSRSNCGLSAPSNEILIFVVGFTGDVQVSVAWDAPSDVDLHVVDPFGEEIFYGNTTSASGGQLDVDSNPACNIDGRQIENIRWGSRAPGGSYTVRVDYWTSCGVPVTNYTVTIKNGASTSRVDGRFTGDGDRGGFGAGVLIGSFVHAGALLSDRSAPMFRAPMLTAPSAEKLRQSAASR